MVTQIITYALIAAWGLLMLGPLYLIIAVIAKVVFKNGTLLRFFNGKGSIYWGK